MVIYLDQAFLLNSLLDYLLLIVCGTITAAPLKRRRILLAAALGGLYAVGSLLPEFHFIGNLPYQAMIAAAMCLVAFGPERALPRQIVVLLLLAAAFCGIVLLLTEVFSAPASLVGRRVYYPMSLGALVLSAGGAFGLMEWGLSRLTHQGGDIVPVTVRIGGRSVSFTALRDTGNTLRDPISGCPVMVADGKLLSDLLGKKPDPGALRHPAELVSWLGQIRPELTPRLIPYQTVGVEYGMLPAIRPEEVEISGKKETVLLAFSPAAVSDGSGYKALLGGAI